MRRPILAALALPAGLLLASPAMADPAVHLRWDDCGAAGTSLKAFACDTNSAAELLYVSFVPPAGITAFAGFEARVQLMTSDGNLSPIPSWWDMASCRSGSLQLNLNFVAGPYACADPWNGAAAGGAFYSATPRQLLFVGALPSGSEHPLDPGTEYYAGALVIRNVKTVGPSACIGCSPPLGLYMASAKIVQATAGNEYVYPDSLRATGVPPPYVNWQCAGAPHLYRDISAGYSIDGWSFPGCATPAVRRSWGAIKSLYR